MDTDRYLLNFADQSAATCAMASGFQPMLFTSKRALIEQIRREKFGIGTARSNPLAGMLHEAIAHLSAELYQKDIHFISELLQNAEDNSYETGVIPSLELVLTTEDIACVRAPSTLVLFNNEMGFQCHHVEALCGVGHSTKKGKRNAGYIGEKGIGFKSVFLVTQCPHVISNGYQIKFTEKTGNEANIGYVVPEWTKVPTNATLRRIYGKELPQTMIVLPLRSDKVKAVQEQLKQISPETILFLSRIRQLTVREIGGDLRLRMWRSGLSANVTDTIYKSCTMNLCVQKSKTQASEKTPYFLLKMTFPVTHPVEQRKEVKNWIIELAFPILERNNAGRSNGDIYAFLPSALVSGFPFIVNADFLLVSSRETLKFDSPWNVGILSCIPRTFTTAFNLLLSQESASFGNAPAVAVEDAYRYIPIRAPHCPQLRDVQQRILENLKRQDIVLVDPFLGYNPIPGANNFCKPAKALMIDPYFRDIMIDAMNENNMNPALSEFTWTVVDREVQDRYPETLRALGVHDMSADLYVECLKRSNWLLKLSEKLYWDVVYYGLRTVPMNSPSSRYMFTYVDKVPILKYCREDGSVALASVNEAKSEFKIFISPSEQDGWLSWWTTAFKRWVPLVFMPKSTGETLSKVLQEKNWAFLTSVVAEFSVEGYLQQLLRHFITSVDPKFVVLATKFMFQCFQAKFIELHDISHIFGKEFPVVDESGRIQWAKLHSTVILLPSTGSLWPSLKLSTWYSGAIPLSTKYLPTSVISGHHQLDPLQLESFRSFLKSTVGAVDLPHITLPSVPLPHVVVSKMTVNEAFLLLQWLTFCLPQMEKTGNVFLDNLKESKWLQTEKHGLQRPSDCFWEDTFSSFFTSFDVPFVYSPFTCFKAILTELGVLMDENKGSDVVAKQLLRISHDPASMCDLVRATRFYYFLQEFLWEPSLVESDSKETVLTLKIFVPGSIEKNTGNSWKESGSCVIGNVDDFFDGSLTVLEDLYPEDLLPFFSEVLRIPTKAPVEKYCELWMKWRADGREVSVAECARMWKIIAKRWKCCDEIVWKEFVAQACVPATARTAESSTSSRGSGEFRLSSSTTCLIPDDLNLCSLFSACSDMPDFVWYPDNTQRTESLFNELYSAMGVKALSELVESKFNSPKSMQLVRNVKGSKKRKKGIKRKQQGDRIICEGLFRAVLGFLSQKKYKLSSTERKEIIMPLIKALEVTITSPFARSYTLHSTSDSSPIVVTQENVMAHWSRAEEKLYCLDRENEALKSSLAWRDFRTQLATTLANGLLSQHPTVADELADFLNLMIGSGFGQSEVDYELRRKKAKFYEEDESVLRANVGQLGKRKTNSKVNKQGMSNNSRFQMCTRSLDRRTRSSSGKRSQA